MKKALMIIDVQKDYFTAGKMELYQPEKALQRINKLEESFLALEWPIIYIQHINVKKDASFFIPNTKGAKLHEKLKLRSHSIIIEKNFPNSFKNTQLLDILQYFKVEQVVITGMMTHMCVDSTTRAAAELGFKPILLTDATATRSLNYLGEEVTAKQVQISYLAALQNFAILQTVDTFLGKE
ncbi:cysteine hydrolase [Lactococcus taiwanensis]|uniref:Cysteine hydrolase n=1 Tax=Lactococcus taiwanensis TaxID=1151742 RepID=A0AA45KH51_9LACT|nr:cysteine hydrolase family protein [Lactococcus taiwanensis]QSE76936.1 cysteine hydrolase [Lactococcus taiwanensis]